MCAKNNKLFQFQNLLSYLFASLPLTVAISVLIGWYTNNPQLIQVSVKFVAMQFNTALCFILSAVSALAYLQKKISISFITAGLSFCIAALTLMQYFFNLDLQVDEFFMQHYITVETQYPGRMAASTGVCFLLVNSALIVLVTSIKEQNRFKLLGIIASLVLGISIVNLAAYQISPKAEYGWGGFSRMAVHTAIGFMLNALFILLIAWKHSIRLNYQSSPDWLPYVLAIWVNTMTVCLWLALDAHERKLSNLYAADPELNLLNSVFFVFGVLLSIALFIASNAQQKARRREFEIDLINQKLNLEIKQRQRVILLT